MKSLSILGSTGSVGTTTLDVIRSHPERFRVVALAAGRNLELLEQQAAEFQPGLVSVATAEDARALADRLPSTKIVFGRDGLERAADHESAHLVVSALVGAAGLAPAVAALRAGKDLALANKEALVMAGELVMSEVERAGVSLRPIDSEHSALGQLLQAVPAETVDRLILTASGGPFRTWSRARMETATIDEALAHPTWRMGPKISIDSATLMNKGLEIIEAHHLFATPEDRIDVVVHPQSLVHAAVRFMDGTLMAQLSVSDMGVPILRALSSPESPPPRATTLDLAEVGRLDFEKPDLDRFPALHLAREVLRVGGELPAVLNAVNEVAVGVFLSGNCSFDRIAGTMSAVMERWIHPHRIITTVEQALAVDAEARRLAFDALGNTGATSGVPSS